MNNASSGAKRQTTLSGVQLRSGERNGGCREVSNGAKRQTTPVVLTMRRLDNGDDGRLGRRGYDVRVGRGGTPGMMTVVFDGGDIEKSLWL